MFRTVGGVDKKAARREYSVAGLIVFRDLYDGPVKENKKLYIKIRVIKGNRTTANTPLILLIPH